jgi:hypothetical protein
MWYSRTGHRWQYNMAHALCIPDNLGYTQSAYNTRCFSMVTMVTRTRLSATVYFFLCRFWRKWLQLDTSISTQKSHKDCITDRRKEVCDLNTKCQFTHTRARARACVHTRAHTHTHSRARTHACTHIHILVRARAHTHTPFIRILEDSTLLGVRHDVRQSDKTIARGPTTVRTLQLSRLFTADLNELRVIWISSKIGRYLTSCPVRLERKSWPRGAAVGTQARMQTGQRGSPARATRRFLLFQKRPQWLKLWPGLCSRHTKAPTPTPRFLKLRLLHKSSICINNGKPTDVSSPPRESSGYCLDLKPIFKYKSNGYCSCQGSGFGVSG